MRMPEVPVELQIGKEPKLSIAAESGGDDVRAGSVVFSPTFERLGAVYRIRIWAAK